MYYHTVWKHISILQFATVTVTVPKWSQACGPYVFLFFRVIFPQCILSVFYCQLQFSHSVLIPNSASSFFLAMNYLNLHLL